MPQDIKSLFQYLLDSIRLPDRRTAYQTLAIVWKLRESNCPNMSLFRYTFLNDFEKDANFALEAELKDPNAGEVELSSRI